MKRIILLTLLGTIGIYGQNQKNKFDYLDEIPPDTVPKVFAEGTISIEDRWEGNVNFSPDGNEIYFNVTVDSIKTIYRSVRKDEGWTEPTAMEELKGLNTWEPFITWDGQRFYFISDRPPGNPEWNGRIWYMHRKGGKWLTPINLDLQVPVEKGLWFPNVTKRGVLYFGAALRTTDSVGQGDMYAMDLADKKIKLLKNLCSESEDWDPFVAPDESFILFASNRPGGYGNTDLYVSFKNPENDEWDPPKNLGATINTENYEVAARVTPDGKYLFFDRPIKGTQDIYWVSIEAVLKLRD